jgi:enoyl-CoA hydratase/carnithine racemase
VSEGPIRLERDGDVAVVVLDDPPLNLFGPTTMSGLRDACEEIAGSDARCAVFRADGELFTGGVDVEVFSRVEGGREGGRLAADVLEVLTGFERLDIPTLALIHGTCLTAGWETALACDMIWAAEGTQVGLVERVVGLTPFGGGVQRMAARVGPARAAEFVMTGRLYPAERMLEWGAINRVVPAADLVEKGIAFARELASGPTVAHGATKRLIRAWAREGLAGADAITAEEAAGLFDTEDLEGAVRSFLADGPGKATFQGR